MLEFQKVSFQYDQDHYKMLENLSFSVNDGKFYSIIGESGCGKSTIFRLINGLETQQSGEILYQGKSIQGQNQYSAFMPQKDMLFPWRDVEKNVCLPMELQGVSKAEQEKRCQQVLEQVGLSQDIHKMPRELSGGMRQRVAFARTLMTGADMLLLDEPFSALDFLTRVEMQEWLLTQWETTKKTILFITHDVEEAIFLSEAVFIIRNRPITQMEKIEIPLPYPRKREDLKQPELIALKEDLIAKLRRRDEK